MNNIVLHKKNIEKGFSRAANTYDENALVQKKIALKMIDFIKESNIIVQNANILEIGAGTGFFSELIIKSFNPQLLILNEISNTFQINYSHFDSQSTKFILGDAEEINFPTNIDAILSCSTFQWFENIEKFINKCYNALSDSGIIAFSTFGKDNLKEIKSIYNIGLKYLSIDDWKQIFFDKFELMLLNEESIVLELSSGLDVLKHLKKTGVNSIENKIWTKNKLLRFCSEYNDRYGDGECVLLTYNPIWIIAKKKNK